MSEPRPGTTQVLAGLGLTGDRLRALASYLDLLQAWGMRSNLSGLSSSTRQAEVLIRPILALAPLLPPGRLIDVGSGNGSPGLVVAALRPDLSITLLEPRLKRWAFLREAVRAMRRDDVRVLRQRHDAYSGPAVEALTLRALKLPLSALTALLLPGGQVFAIGHPPEASPGFTALGSLDLGGTHLHRFLGPPNR